MRQVLLLASRHGQLRGCDLPVGGWAPSTMFRYPRTVCLLGARVASTVHLALLIPWTLWSGRGNRELAEYIQVLRLPQVLGQ